MPALVTENWSTREYQRGVRGAREFVVTGVNTEAEAETAPEIPQVGAAFIYDPTLIMQTHPKVRFRGPFDYLVNVEYLPPPSGGGQPTPTPQFIAEVEVGTGSDSDITDHYADGTPIITPAGQLFDPLPSLTRTTKHYTVYRDVPFYSDEDAQIFENHVNLDQIIIPGVGTLLPLCLLCERIYPVTRITPANLPPTQRIAMEFIRGQRLTPAEINGDVSPFDHRILAHSAIGFFSEDGETKPGQFVDGNNQPVQREIPVDIRGLPIEDGYKVMPEGGTGEPRDPVASNVNITVPHEISDNGYTFIRGPRHLRRAFYPLFA